jgi:hypothetical protein
MRRPTLDEKRYGPGFVPGPATSIKVKEFHKCYIENCRDKVYGTAELYVDETPPTLDWYTRMLAKLPAHSWVTLPFCFGHLEDVVKRSNVYQEEPDLWAPWRARPPVLPRPPKIIEGGN